MEEQNIKTHDFETAKNQIKVFSEQTQLDCKLDKVNTEGWFFGLGDHNVTGHELNELISKIQKNMIDSNSLFTKFIKEFGQVYNALEALDKDYIQAILIAIKAAEKANDEVKIAQSDITKAIEIQKKTITALKQFKEKIEGYNHLKNIDDIWSDSQNLKEQFSLISYKTDSIILSLENQFQLLDSFTHFKRKLESYEHLGDIDRLWDVSINVREEISSINSGVENINLSIKYQLRAIETLNQFKTTLDVCEHLKDIDHLWNKSESFSQEISDINEKLSTTAISIDSQEQSISLLMQFKNKLNNFGNLEQLSETRDICKKFEIDLNNSKDIIDVHEGQLDDMKKFLKKMQINIDERNQAFSKKLKIAYVLAGSSLGIAIIELFLLILRIK